MLIGILKILAFIISIGSIIVFLYLIKSDLQVISGKERFELSRKEISKRIISYVSFAVFMAIFSTINSSDPEHLFSSFWTGFIGGFLKTCFRTFPAIFILLFIISSSKNEQS